MLRLRQICLVAAELRPAVDDLKSVLGIDECFHDPGVAKYGLENALLPIGRNFMEVVAPAAAGTAAGRYMDRRGGDGGYIVILQCDDAIRRRAHYADMGVRIANSLDYGDFLGTQLHPKDTGGCMLEVDQQDGDVVDGAWHPAGCDWERTVRSDGATAMTGCTLQSTDPEKLAHHWAKILERPVDLNAGAFRIPLDNGFIDVVEPQDDRGDGLIGVTVQTASAEAIAAAAKQRDLLATPQTVTICGTHFHIS
jgi:hypothetical protein